MIAPIISSFFLFARLSAFVRLQAVLGKDAS
jgi:hypothetical protein